MDLQKITTLKADLEAAYLAEKARLEFFRLEVSAGGFWVVRDVADGAVAGRTLRGHVNFAPESALQAKCLRVRLLGLESAGYTRSTSHRSGSGSATRTEHLVHATDLGQVMTSVDLVTAPSPGSPIDVEFNLAIPPATLPTVNVPGYRIDWVLEFALVVDPAEPDPLASHHAPIVVSSSADASGAGDSAAGFQAEIDADGSPPCPMCLSPAPLVSGSVFSGYARLTGPDPRRMRVVIEAIVKTSAPSDVPGGGLRISGAGMTLGGPNSVSTGLNETVELWRGPVEAGPAGTLQFGGIVPAAANVVGPNGSVGLRLGLVEDRRMMLDKYWRRPVAIVARQP